jgi:hypothetical protein
MAYKQQLEIQFPDVSEEFNASNIRVDELANSKFGALRSLKH